MSTNPLVSQYEPVYGTLYYSVVAATAFYGITCMQTFFFYVHYRSGHLGIKIFVAALWALDTTHEALIVVGAYKYLMNGFVNPSTFQNDIPELVVQFLLTVVVTTLAQGFFIHRLYLFSKKNMAAPLIWAILGIIQIVSAILYVAKALYSVNGTIQVVAISELGDKWFTGLATLCLSVAAGVDVLVAMFLTFLLLRERAATPFKSTEHILQRLTVFAVNTGIVTATFAATTVIGLHFFKSEMFYAVISVTLCSIYCNTLLANLNARTYIRSEATTYNTDVELYVSKLPASNDTSGDERGGGPKTVPSAYQGAWETEAVVTFPDTNRSTSSEDV